MDFLLMKDYSINFGNKNTWTDWHLVPTNRPVINPPQLKKKTIDIPGGNGSLDLSESLTGYPVFENRTGSIELYVANEYEENGTTIRPNWYATYSDVMGYLHGKKMDMTLAEDPTFKYTGRFTVNQWNTQPGHSKITVDYDLEPYKRTLQSSVEADSWNLYYGEAFDPKTKYKNVALTGGTHTILTLSKEHYSDAPINPKFTVISAAGTVIYYYNSVFGLRQTFTLQNGVNYFPELVLYGNSIELTFAPPSGTNGTVSIVFNAGRF